MADFIVPEKYRDLYRSLILDRIETLIIELREDESFVAYRIAAGHVQDETFQQRQQGLTCDAKAISRLVDHAMTVWGFTEEELTRDLTENGLLPLSYINVRAEWLARKRLERPRNKNWKPGENVVPVERKTGWRNIHGTPVHITYAEPGENDE